MPHIPRGGAKALLAVVVLVIAGFSTMYQVQPEEVGVVLRFGRYVGTTDPGLRFKLPLVDQVLKVPVQRQLKQEFGFRTIEAGVRSVYAPADLDLNGEAVMLTGDLNVRCRRVDSPVSRVRSIAVSFQGPQPRGHLPRDERGRHARGGR